MGPVVVVVVVGEGEGEDEGEGVPEEAAPDPAGWNTASKGVRKGVGKTTGTLLTVTNTEGAPSSSVVVPVAVMTWLAPAWSVPVHNVASGVADLASTQQGPEAVIDSR